MTEDEWRACTDPDLMLAFLQGKTSDRKLRLYACGCCRRVWHLLSDSRSRHAVEAAEQVADGDLDIASLQGILTGPNQPKKEVADLCMTDAWWAASLAALHTASRVSEETYDPTGERYKAEGAAQCHLLRELFNNPFHPIVLKSAWRTRRGGTVIKLAEAIYASRAFDRLPILADALEEAGCQAADILGHCRQPGAVHVKGCWLVDVILSKDRSSKRL